MVPHHRDGSFGAESGRPSYDTVHAAEADGCFRLRFRTGPAIKASIHWLSLRRKPAVPLNVTPIREAAAILQ